MAQNSRFNNTKEQDELYARNRALATKFVNSNPTMQKAIDEFMSLSKLPERQAIQYLSYGCKDAFRVIPTTTIAYEEKRQHEEQSQLNTRKAVTRKPAKAQADNDILAGIQAMLTPVIARLDALETELGVKDDATVLQDTEAL